MHGSWIHFILNMWLLWIFGDNVEDRMGRVRFLTFYLLCGMIAGIAHIYANPHSLAPTIGASGAIAGIMGAFFFMFPYARIVIWVFFLPLFVTVPAIAFLGLWVIIQLYKATTGLVSEGYADIAWFGHLGGFLAGALLHRLFVLDDRMPARGPFDPQVGHD
jgi:membrane associated rhomboid family serine protease